MAGIEMLKTFVNKRLTAAAEEIFGVFERTIIRYEEEIDRQRKLVDLVSKPEINLRRADHLLLLVCEEEVPPEQQQQRSLSLGQEDPEPPQIKEEHEELWTSLGGEQLQGLEEADFKIPFTPVPVRRETEEDKYQSTQTRIEEDGEGDPLPGISTEETQTEPHVEPESYYQASDLPSTSTEQMKTEPHVEPESYYQASDLLSTSTEQMKTEPHVEPESYYQASDLPSTSTEQMKTEPEGEDCGVSEPDSNFVDTEPTPDGQLLSSDYYRTETEDSDAWKETRELQSGLNRWTSKMTQKVKGQSLSICNKFEISGESSSKLKSSNQTASHCKVCRKSFTNRRSFLNHVKIHPLSCGLCGKHLEPTESLKLHIHAHQKCYICGREFSSFAMLERHERIHTGEKPFSCTFCGKGFSRHQHLQNHLRIHTGEKPFSCTICGKGLGRNEQLQNHLRTHTGEKPFSCAVCGKRFNEKGTVKIHMRIHTGDKPFSCGICGKRFRHSSRLRKHRCPTGE